LSEVTYYRRMRDAKVLITGPTGQLAAPIAQALAVDNEVWGIARFSEPGSRERVEAAGVKTLVCDLADADFSALPDDFTYVLHLAAVTRGGNDYDWAISVNAEGTGLLLQHCRKAKAALVMSTHSVYKPQEAHDHVFVETDPLGDVNAANTPTYSVAKIGQEAVARYCARAFDLPVIIARMNAAYYGFGGLPMTQVEATVAGQAVHTRWDPCWYSPIHQDDINDQTEALLAGASVPATIVNWAGDEPVSVQDWCSYSASLIGREANVVVSYPPGTLKGSIADNSRRLALAGPCKVPWRDGMRRMMEDRHPDLLKVAEG
jgi:nucleoside-diphosphate-sugar epimerase